jgi:hypothetical protein
MKFWNCSVASSWSGVSNRRAIMVAGAYAACLLAAAAVKNGNPGSIWQVGAAALILAICPVVVALMLRPEAEATQPLVAAALILAAPIFLPPAMGSGAEEWARQLFSLGGNAGFYIFLLGMVRYRTSRPLIGSAIFLALLSVVVTFLL